MIISEIFKIMDFYKYKWIRERDYLVVKMRNRKLLSNDRLFHTVRRW